MFRIVDQPRMVLILRLDNYIIEFWYKKFKISLYNIELYNILHHQDPNLGIRIVFFHKWHWETQKYSNKSAAFKED